MKASYRYQIRNTATGETRVCEMKLNVTSLRTFWWLADGNMGCDCNRHMDFLRAGGATEEELDRDPNIDCSDGRFALDWVECDGVRFIENDKPTENAADD